MKKYTLIAIFLSMNIFSDMVYKFDNQDDELRFNNLIKEIRCPKCTSGSLSSSNAPISEDLKLKIVEMIKDGKSDSDIKQYVSDRFGKESLYDPEFTQQTYILWFGPLIFIVIAFIIFFFRKKT
jgi:cytochrome c-type biogenesis protein CcmH